MTGARPLGFPRTATGVVHHLSTSTRVIRPLNVMVTSARDRGTAPTGASTPQTGGLLTGCLPADFTVRPGTFSTSTGVTAFPYSLAPGAGIASPGPSRAGSQRANCLRERDGKITYTAS